MSWNDADPDDTPVEAHTRHCVPERFNELPTEPIKMSELLEYAHKLMEKQKEYFDNVMLYSMSGGDQAEESTDPYRVKWQNEITDNPAQSKGKLLKAIKRNRKEALEFLKSQVR